MRAGSVPSCMDPTVPGTLQIYEVPCYRSSSGQACQHMAALSGLEEVGVPNLKPSTAALHLSGKMPTL